MLEIYKNLSIKLYVGVNVGRLMSRGRRYVTVLDGLRHSGASDHLGSCSFC